MAIVIEANYSKKVGLPHYSSHQYCITLRTEIADLAQAQTESARLYALLQTSVDRELQQTGFLPEPAAENRPTPPPSGARNGSSQPADGYWQCSFKQRQLIERLIEENRLEGTEVEELARDRFNLPVNRLNKLQASGLIEELFAKYSGKRFNGNGRANGNGYPAREYSHGGAR